MKQQIVKKIQEKLRLWVDALFQYVWITLELFNKHGLANHAAAGAYGFLFSAAPALLIVSFFVFGVLKSSPETAAALIGQIGLLGAAFDMRGLTETFLTASKPGITGLISIISLLWTARIFTLSLQRGLGVIFPDTETINPLTKMTVSAGMEVSIVLFTFIVVFTSEAAFVMYRIIGVFPFNQPWFIQTSKAVSLLLPLAVLGFLIFGAYMLVPARLPAKNAALKGAVFCVSFTLIILAGSSFIANPAKYNILYGTLGNLFILLADVYLFFIFFFLGAELTFIIHSFDALLLSRFIQAHTKTETGKKPSFQQRCFLSTGGTLQKYLWTYRQGEALFYKGEQSREVYYILTGQAEVYLDETTLLALIEPGKFFGEMGHVLAAGRSATIKAHADLKVLRIPFELFQEVLKSNADADRKVIENLSERLKNVNEKLVAPDSAVSEVPEKPAEKEP
jgi:membrane protein